MLVCSETGFFPCALFGSSEPAQRIQVALYFSELLRLHGFDLVVCQNAGYLLRQPVAQLLLGIQARLEEFPLYEAGGSHRFLRKFAAVWG